MTRTTKIQLLKTGVSGLDHVLGGGLPVGSFNVIGGEPGAGKTTLAHQILFANCTEKRAGLFCTVVGEPPVKMLRYQQQFSFFDVHKVGRAVHYLSLTDGALSGDVESVSQSILDEVRRLQPAFVVIDSFRSVTRMIGTRQPADRMAFHGFVQRLANTMTQWEATTFLLGEFDHRASVLNPIFTMADGVIWMRQVPDGDTRVRKLTVTKVRGQEQLAGHHVYRIGPAGVRVFPRALTAIPAPDLDRASPRVTSGVLGLDTMMSGGFIRGDAIILSGPSGSGKSILGMQFAAAGLRQGEGVVIATFEESLEKYLERARSVHPAFSAALAEDRLRIVHRRPLDMSVDETFEEIRDMVAEIGAERVVVDSLSGLQVAASDAGSDRLRQSMGRLVHTLTGAGATVLMTAELQQRMDQLGFTPLHSSFLADDVILQRYVEVRGRLEKVMSVVKMRRSAHSGAFHRYQITVSGIEVGEALENFRGILTGIPEVSDPASASAMPIDPNADPSS